MVVLIRATQYHMEVVDTCEPRITGPMTTGSKLESCSRRRANAWVCDSSGVSHGPLRTLKVSTHHVLQRMGVGGHHANGGGPLMVLLVETFVEVWLVEQPERGGGETFMLVRRGLKTGSGAVDPHLCE